MLRDKGSNRVESLSSGRPPAADSRTPMMRELLRWSNPTRVKIVRRRWAEWAEWARSMTSRHHPVTVGVGHAMTPMTFVQPARLVQLHQRLINFSLNFHSKMNLAIQPILREIRMGQERVIRSRDAQTVGSRAYPPGNADTNLRAAGLADETGAVLPAAPPTFARQRLAEPGAYQVVKTRSAASTTREHSISGSEGFSPGLPLVFRRLQPDESAGSRDRTDKANNKRLALRLAGQSKRVEESMPGSAPHVARRLPAATAQQAAPQVVTTEYTSQQTLGMFRSNEQWRGNTPQMPEAMLEQVTERVIREIDHRTIAWRERMGKT